MAGSQLLNKFDWHENPHLDHALAESITNQFRIPSAGARFLVSRGLSSAEQIARYLAPSEADAGDPFAFANMEAAVSAVERAAEQGRSVLVHGDYDVDGISGTALLYQYLSGIFETVYRFLPDRRRDGYGLSERAVDWALAEGVGLVVTVDCGVSDGELVERLRSKGVDVIVCDHHDFPETGGAEGLVLNPKRDGETYPNSDLCGTGVAFKFVQALHKRGVRGDTSPETLVDLLALATVGDMMPLTGENRFFVKAGLELINSSPRPGLEAIKSYSRIGARPVTAGHIGFIFGPRLNAPGRVARPKPALEILTTASKDEARRLASELEYDNEKRRSLTDIVRDDAFERIKAMNDRASRGGFVLAAEHWDEGVLGIAAARVAEEFGRPAILLSVKGDLAKGSGRSVRGVNLKKHVDRLQEFFVKYGGHQQAVGLTMKSSRIEPFAMSLSDSLKEDIDLDKTAPPLVIDGAINLEECSPELLDFLSRCEPFGYGNREPVWKIADVQVMRETTYVGDNHLKLFFQDPRGNPGNAIAFGWDRPETPDDLHNRAVDVAVKIKKGHYMGNDYTELRLVDLRSHRG
ncbi:MAG: single-stranded-DNA-specific exonuclease RecJ [Candidatus Latescibacterota bacterium]|jgi:single-stranded-DNA-specific exonuclease